MGSQHVQILQKELNMTHQIRTALQRRRDIQANAERMGINDEYISLLVDTFYKRVRKHPELGPVFTNRIDDWQPHLAKMKDFWASVTMNAGRYAGKPVPVHQALTEVRGEHFKIWLEIFEQTLNDTAPNHDVVIYFMQRAQRIADSLQLAMFGVPGLKHRLNAQPGAV